MAKAISFSQRTNHHTLHKQHCFASSHLLSEYESNLKRHYARKARNGAADSGHACQEPSNCLFAHSAQSKRCQVQSKDGKIKLMCSEDVLV